MNIGKVIDDAEDDDSAKPDGFKTVFLQYLSKATLVRSNLMKGYGK